MGDEDALMCTVCMRLLYRPRVFDNCGHTFCEICQLKHDHAQMEQTTSATSYPAFCCPVCRKASMRRWFERPLNVMVDQMVRVHPDYEERKAEVEEEFEEWVGCHEGDQFGVLRMPTDDSDEVDLTNVNLARVASRARASKAHHLYRQMLPALCDAASNGTCRVSFTTNSRELNCVAETLARLLHRHGIHSMHSTAHETTVFMTHDSPSWTSDYRNPEYDADAVEADEAQFVGRFEDEVGF